MNGIWLVLLLLLTSIGVLSALSDGQLEKYLLMSMILEEISNAELFYMILLDWSTQHNVTMVEPFVCDSYIGGLPGWTVEPEGLFVRNSKCKLNPYSWYRNISKSKIVSALNPPLPYQHFIEASHSCQEWQKSTTQYTPEVGYGHCVEICLLITIGHDENSVVCPQETLHKFHVVEKYGRWLSVDPFANGIETSLSFVHFECWHSSKFNAIGLHSFFERAEKMKKDGECKTASVSIHCAGKLTYDSLIEHVQHDWGGYERKLSDIAQSQAMVDIANTIKKDMFGNEPYIAVQLRARKLSTDLHQVGFTNCFQKIVDNVNHYMKKYTISKVFLASDLLQRNTTGYHDDKESNSYMERIFEEVMLKSAINWSLNVEKTYGDLWQYDRGAHAMVDQLIARDAEYFLFSGGGSFTSKIIHMRGQIGRPSNEVSCLPKELEKEEDKEDKEKEKDQQKDKQGDKQQEEKGKQDNNQHVKQKDKQDKQKEEDKMNFKKQSYDLFRIWCLLFLIINILLVRLTDQRYLPLKKQWMYIVVWLLFFYVFYV